MVYPFDQSDLDDEAFSFYTGVSGPPDENFAIIVYMEVDNAKCGTICFQNTGDLTNYMAAALSTELRDDWSVVQIGETNNLTPKDSKSPIGIIIGILIIALVTVAIGVIVQSNKRKIGKGITWFPEGFQAHPPRSSQRKGPDGREMSDWPGSKHPSQFDIDTVGYGDGWSDDDPNERPSKRQNRRDVSSGQTILPDYDDTDQRGWTAQHLSAADVKNTDMLGALTPPQAEVMMNERLGVDVDARGPCGLTPLMVASFRGGGLDQGDLNEEEG